MEPALVPDTKKYLKNERDLYSHTSARERNPKPTLGSFRVSAFPAVPDKESRMSKIKKKIEPKTKDLVEILNSGTPEEIIETMIFAVLYIITCDTSITPTTEIVPGMSFYWVKDNLQRSLRHFRAIKDGIYPVPKGDTVSMGGVRHCIDLIDQSGYSGETPIGNTGLILKHITVALLMIEDYFVGRVSE
jgi:hypothetical protein